MKSCGCFSTWNCKKISPSQTFNVYKKRRLWLGISDKAGLCLHYKSKEERKQIEKAGEKEVKRRGKVWRGKRRRRIEQCVDLRGPRREGFAEPKVGAPRIKGEVEGIEGEKAICERSLLCREESPEDFLQISTSLAFNRLQHLAPPTERLW